MIKNEIGISRNQFLKTGYVLGADTTKTGFRARIIYNNERLVAVESAGTYKDEPWRELQLLKGSKVVALDTQIPGKPYSSTGKYLSNNLRKYAQ